MQTCIFNKCFPVKPVKKRYRNRLPWLTNGLKISIKTKNNLYKRLLKYPSAYNQNKYSEYRNLLTSQMKKAEKDYYQTLIIENKSSMRKTWTIIKSVINNNKSNKVTSEFKTENSQIITDKAEISNKFNKYFINVEPSLASKIPDSSKNYRDFLPPWNEESMYLDPVSCDELKKIISKLNDRY